MILVIKMPKKMSWAGHESPNLYFDFQYPHPAINDIGEGSGNNVYRNSVFTVQTQEQAKILATKLVQENPGYEVYITTATAVFQSATVEVIEKTVTEKGVLPT